MGNLMDICRNAMLGTLRGFDRMVFHGRLKFLQYAEGAERFFTDKGILFKDAKKWVSQNTALITEDVDRISREQTGTGIMHIRSSRERKEEMVRKYQQVHGITEGLIGAWSCVEECLTYGLAPADGRPRLVPRKSRCKHIYLYLDDPTFGLMSIRLQTWMPYLMQVAINGREWMSKQLLLAGIGHERYRNKIIACDNFAYAQSLLDQQASVSNWGKILRQFVPQIFPSMATVVGQEAAYTWYCWQSEWATDLISQDIALQRSIMEGVMNEALITGTTDRILRYFDRSTNADGRLRRNAAVDVSSRMLHYADGMRVRHWLNGNSVKIYNQLNTIRIETTVNNPKEFKVIRPVGKNSETRAVPMRKGIQDVSKRAKASNAVNERVIQSLDVHHDATRMEDVFAKVTRNRTEKGRRIRGLRPFDKDTPVLTAISSPEMRIGSFNNATLCAILKTKSEYRDKTDRQLSGIVTRYLRLLRDHGIIRKLPKQRRYQLTPNGAKITTAINAMLRTDISGLIANAA